MRTGVETSKVERADDGTVTVTVSSDSGEETVTADEIVAALGRRPNSSDIGLDTVGLEPGKAVEVDDTLRSRRTTGCTRPATSTAASR